MVKITYKGQNYILFGKHRIGNGVTEIPDEEFYRLMKTPTFSARVRSNVFQVPKGFPLEHPLSLKKTKEKVEVHEVSDHEDHDEDHSSDHHSVKELLKKIHSSKDTEFLRGIVQNDSRVKVLEAARKKLESLHS